MKINFNNIHKNKKWAFVDGLLSGTVITYMIASAVLNKRDRDHQSELREVRSDTHHKAFTGGWESNRQHLRPYLDMDFYEKIHGPFDKEN